MCRMQALLRMSKKPRIDINWTSIRDPSTSNRYIPLSRGQHPGPSVLQWQVPFQRVHYVGSGRPPGQEQPGRAASTRQPRVHTHSEPDRDPSRQSQRRQRTLAGRPWVSRTGYQSCSLQFVIVHGKGAADDQAPRSCLELGEGRRPVGSRKVDQQDLGSWWETGAEWAGWLSIQPGWLQAVGTGATGLATACYDKKPTSHVLVTRRQLPISISRQSYQSSNCKDKITTVLS